MQYAACLTGGSFDEARMLQNIEACEWLANALKNLEGPHLDRSYANMRSVCKLYALILFLSGRGYMQQSLVIHTS